MAVVAEIIWYKADFNRANHNNEDFIVPVTCWRLFRCVGLNSNKIFGTVYVKKASHLCSLNQVENVSCKDLWLKISAQGLFFSLADKFWKKARRFLILCYIFQASQWAMITAAANIN